MAAVAALVARLGARERELLFVAALAESLTCLLQLKLVRCMTVAAG